MSDHHSRRTDKRGQVALFIPSLAGGGAERAMLNIARQLIRHEFTVDLLVTRRNGAFFSSVPEHVRLINLQSWKTLTCLPKLVQYIRNERPTILVSALDFGNLAALLTKTFFTRNLRLVIRQDGHYTTHYKLSGFVLRCVLRLMVRLLPAADAIVAVSHGVAEDLKRTAPRAAGLVQTILNPVAAPAVSEKAQLPVEHRWFGDPRTPVILTAGRLDILHKDQPTLFKAFAEVQKTRAARLLVLGEGPDQAKLVALADELEIRANVDFIGFQSNPFAYMARSQVFVLSSACEGLPTVLIEALACGTPVVSTDCPGGPREILEDGKWGYLVPVGDWQGLAYAILNTLDRPLPQDLLIARAQYYSETHSIGQHLSLLSRVTR